jgi:hypothetical protein
MLSRTATFYLVSTLILRIIAMSQTEPRDLWGGTSQVCTNLLRNFSPLLQKYVVDSHRSHCKGGLTSVTALDAFFPCIRRLQRKKTTRSTTGNKMLQTEFLSSWVLMFAIYATTLINLNTVGWSFFCSCRRAALRVRPRPQAELSGHLRILCR